jgi:hypothetical protein
MNRLITTLVQLSIAIPALYMGRMVLREMIADFREWDKTQ